MVLECGSFKEWDRQRVLPKLTIVRLDATDDGKNDGCHDEHNQHRDPNENEREQCAQDSVEYQRDNPIHDDFSMLINAGKFVFLNLPDNDRGNEAGDGGYVSCQEGEVQEHGPGSCFPFFVGVGAFGSVVIRKGLSLVQTDVDAVST